MVRIYTVYGLPATVHAQPPAGLLRVGDAMPRPVPPEGRWTDRHRVISFYASAELITWIEEEKRRSGRSKTQVIVTALDKERQPQAPSSRRQRSRREPTGS